MTLIDAGPRIALIDKGRGKVHERCLAAQESLTSPLLTTWSCFTEAMYFLGELRGWAGQNALWKFIQKDALLVHQHTFEETERMRELMERYQNVPMDLADASLVVLAETQGLRRIFTLDGDFFIYRINKRDSFEVFP